MASSSGNPDLIRLLVERGADVNACDDIKDTGLMLGAQGGHIGAVEALIELNADVTRRNNSGGTALSRGAKGGHLEVCRMLVEAKADPTARDALGRSALEGLIQSEIDAYKLEKQDQAKQLAGEKVEARGLQRQFSIIEPPIEGQKLATVQFLLEAGASPSCPNPNESSPSALMLAAKVGHQMLCTLLLEHGADPELAVQCAKDGGHDALAQALQTAVDHRKAKY